MESNVGGHGKRSTKFRAIARSLRWHTQLSNDWANPRRAGPKSDRASNGVRLESNLEVRGREGAV